MEYKICSVKIWCCELTAGSLSKSSKSTCKHVLKSYSLGAIQHIYATTSGFQVKRHEKSQLITMTPVNWLFQYTQLSEAYGGNGTVKHMYLEAPELLPCTAWKSSNTNVSHIFLKTHNKQVMSNDLRLVV